MEAGELDWAVDLARRALSRAVGLRHALSEVRAWSLLRRTAYRRGEAMVPDVDLAADLDGRVPPMYAGLASLTEAAVAWRLGRHDVACRIAASSAAAFDRAMNRGGAVLARALRFAASGPGAPDERPPDVPPIGEVPVGVRLQTLALIAPLVDVALGADDVSAVRALSAQHCFRREILGDDEIRARLAGTFDRTDLER
jgi:hypothetical protein